MHRILPLLCDAGLGIFVFLAVSHAYRVEDGWSGFLIFCIFLPDLDSFSQLHRKGYVAASAEDPVDHREFLHKPVLWLLPSLMLWVAFGYVGALLFFLFLVHFLHDSVLTGWGVPWLSPWNRTRIKFFADETNHESLRKKDWVRTWRPDELAQMIRAHGNEDWIRDLYMRLTPVSVIEYSIFALGILTLGASLFTSV
jgi:hypothetical protein